MERRRRILDDDLGKKGLKNLIGYFCRSHEFGKEMAEFKSENSSSCPDGGKLCISEFAKGRQD